MEATGVEPEDRTISQEAVPPSRIISHACPQSGIRLTLATRDV